ncbi:MAG: hypothetical protein PHZ04_05450 [Patescibacteria group bacterium]|nr:hypothetical protein [Patescibacteria group bacterium]MDD5294486.1 hypothetical protein [Patescibacteria group bacterium]MDD5554328.1 hypothetical protein [Patescibacteria group bacterium]
MIAVVDTSLGKLLEAVERNETDFDSSGIVLVEAELSDLDGGDANPDPQRGLNIALIYASRGKPVIIVGEKEYDDLKVWGELFSNPEFKVAFCQKPVTSESFREALEKIMPEASI